MAYAEGHPGYRLPPPETVVSFTSIPFDFLSPYLSKHPTLLRLAGEMAYSDPQAFLHGVMATQMYQLIKIEPAPAITAKDGDEKGMLGVA